MWLIKIFLRFLSIAVVVCFLSFVLTSDYFMSDGAFIGSCENDEIETFDCEFVTSVDDVKDLQITLEILYYSTEFLISFASCFAFGLWGRVGDVREKKSA